MSGTQPPASTLPNLAAQVTTLAGQYGTLSTGLLGVLANISTALTSLSNSTGGAVSSIAAATASALGLVRGGGVGNVTVNADGSLTAPVGGGVTPALSVGSVATGAAGSNAAVTIGGTTTAPVLNFTIPAGSQGAIGTLGTGSATTNTASGGRGYGLERTIKAWLSDVVSVKAYGATDGDGTLVNASPIAGGGGGISATTRAQIAAFTVNGKQPYAGAAGSTTESPWPFSTGDDVLTYAPNTTAAPSSGSTSTIDMQAHITTTGVSFQDSSDGFYYVPVANAAFLAAPGMLAFYSGGPSGGVPVQTAHGGSLVFATLPGVIPSGTVLNVGVDPAKLVVGKQFWTTVGISLMAPTLITNVSGSVITVSPALATTPRAQQIGGTQSGLMAMQPVVLFTPMNESTLGANITMDTLSIFASYYTRDPQFVAGTGTTLLAFTLRLANRMNLAPHPILGGRDVHLVGFGRSSSFLGGSLSSPIITLFPTYGAYQELRDFSVGYYSGYGPAGILIHGQGYSAYAPNENALSGLRLVNVGINVSHASAGAAAGLMLIGCDNVSLECMDIACNGKAAGTCGVFLQNTVLVKTTDMNIHYAKVAFYCGGYTEDVQLDKLSTDNCGGIFDSTNTSIINGLGGLLFYASKMDIDCSDFGIILHSFQNFTISDTSIAVKGGAGPAITLLGCNSGTIVGVNGSCASNVDFILLGNGTVDGGDYPCNSITISAITVRSAKSAANISGGHSGIRVDADLLVLSNGKYVFSTTPVIFTAGSGNKVNGVVV